MPFHAIEEAIEAIRCGRMVILVDDEDRENEGDLILAAEWVTPEAINFMAKHGRGLICLTLLPARVDALQLPLMTNDNTAPYGTAFTVSIDAHLRHGVTTGISAFDRATTIRVAVNPESKASDLVRPGHVFPLRAHQGGVLRRAGQTEGSTDLARLAGLTPAGVLCEVMSEDGTMARIPELLAFARQHDMKIVTIADLIQYRMQRERLVHRVVTAKLPTQFGEFTAILYENDVGHTTYLALVKGVVGSTPTLTRVHSGCLTGDVFSSLRCDCGEQLRRAMELVEREGQGVILYIDQEGRGIGLVNKLKAYLLQDEGLDTVEANRALGFQADLRDYGLGAQVLVDLGLKKIRLMTNNPRKIVGLEGFGLEIIERVPLEITPHERNVHYLRTKKEKLGHMLDQV